MLKEFKFAIIEPPFFVKNTTNLNAEILKVDLPTFVPLGIVNVSLL
jgi:hypothetical protein